MKLSQMIRATSLEQPITPRHEKWLIENENPKYSDKAIAFAKSVLSNEVGGRRKRRGFRASSTGRCKRAQIFGRLGLPQIRRVPDGHRSNIFMTGNFLHLKWQMAGLTEGWLEEAEVPLDHQPLGMSGTADGVIYDGSFFEFKTINEYGFRRIREFGPQDAHLLQVHAYMIAGGFNSASIVYENKATSDWVEERVHMQPEYQDRVLTEQEELTDRWRHKELPDVLPDCARETGKTYRDCPFASICLDIKEFPNEDS